VPVILNHAYCSSCGGRHNLCYPDGDVIFTSREYEYDCPQTKRPARVPKDEWGAVVVACPKDAAIIREVKS
jgi:hypothetical protein